MCFFVCGYIYIRMGFDERFLGFLSSFLCFSIFFFLFLFSLETGLYIYSQN